jgi:colanic acid/amylovoran biosynthesis glycosyltransferase
VTAMRHANAYKGQYLNGARLGIIVSRFPKLTETFVFREIAEMKALGIDVIIYALRREREQMLHPGVEAYIREAHFGSLLSVQVWIDNAWWVIRRPGNYFTALVEALCGTRTSSNYFAGALLYFPLAASFARHAQRMRVQHVHAHFANHPALAALVMRRLTGIPFSFTARGSDIHVDRTMLAQKIAAADLAVTVSNYNRDLMITLAAPADAEKIVVVRGGVDTALFTPASKRTAGPPLAIICVGRFEEVKGHIHLVRACAALRRRGIPFVCSLYGDGELRAAVESEIALHGLTNHIQVHGNAVQEVIAEALRAAHVFVLASVPSSSGKREGIPNVLKEAMACALPVVGSRMAGIPELVEDGVSGILVPPAKSEAIADALERLAADSALRHSMGAAGRARVLADYDLRVSARQRAELFLLPRHSALSTHTNLPRTG